MFIKIIEEDLNAKMRIPDYLDGNSEGIRTLNRNIRTSYRFNFY